MVALTAFADGILFGLLLTLMIGPVFFALIQTSIERGFRSGASMAVGIALSDAAYVVVASFGVVLLASSPSFQAWLGVVGGLIMLVFGLINLLKRVAPPQLQPGEAGADNHLRQLIKGFLLNGINPFVFLFWFGIASLKATYALDQKVVFFSGVLLTVLLTDFLKAYTANQLRQWLSPKFMLRMNWLVGVALIAFSIKLFYFAYEAFSL
ncbi:LysE family translocator [Cesiribacter andamanensis]|uniref:Homoserine/Threonine efflux protein n=1 Tax=Cesiribacter andamanensis AMV16 TaxID=1279009 RepID=M7N5X2_9BACT|nr:LysE family translocator [Cesiribacter andamanensis]EMR02682.1 homoserine/Threonine efflux protein [Cesiribacter andamanensis AMV16]